LFERLLPHGGSDIAESIAIGYNLSVKPVLLAIIGKPLSGKDTQADRLAGTYPEAVKISTGHIIRAVQEEGETHRFWPILGPYIPMMEQGLKLPDAPVLAMLHRVMQEQIEEGKTLLVIAGSPRGMAQLAMFDDMAKEFGADLRMVHIDATDEETYARSARRNEGRVDDDPDIHRTRLEEYRMHVLPMVEHLRRQGRIHELDGMKPADDVFRELEPVVRTYMRDPEITLPLMARR